MKLVYRSVGLTPYPHSGSMHYAH